MPKKDWTYCGEGQRIERFRSKLEAKQAARKSTQANSDGLSVPFWPCKQCQGWHVGTRPEAISSENAEPIIRICHSCDGKRLYPTKEEAERWIASYRERHGTKLRAYPSCGGWHLSSKEKREDWEAAPLKSYTFRPS